MLLRDSLHYFHKKNIDSIMRKSFILAAALSSLTAFSSSAQETKKITNKELKAILGIDPKFL